MNKTKKSRIRKAFLEWSQSVTYHCFPKIFKQDTRLILRLAWSLIFIGLSSLTCFILVNIIIQYYQFGVSTSIQIIIESPTLFPTITICDANPFTTEQAEGMIQDFSLKNFGIDLRNISFEEFISYCSESAYFINAYVKNPSYGDANRKLLGFNMTSAFQICFFSGEICDVTKDFRWFFDTNYGNCFQFNSGYNMNGNPVEVKRVSNGGKNFGLSLLIGPLVNKNQYSTVLSKGLKVLIHNQTYLPSYDDTYVSVKSGEETNIMIDRTFTSNSPYPYTDCTQSPRSNNLDISQAMTNSNRTYQQYDCINLCFQQLVQTKCLCFATFITQIYPTLPCLNSTHLECLKFYRIQFDNNESIYAKNCQQKCPRECDSITYSTQISSLVYPSLETYNRFKNDTFAFNYYQSKYKIDLSSFDLFREYFYSLNIFYASKKYTYISDSPQMTTFSLLSSLGGSLGMFLGFSVFSLLEIFDLLFNLL